MKNNTIYGDEKKILKKHGLWFKKDIAISPLMVTGISILAAVIDGLSTYYTPDPFLKGIAVFSMLITFACAIVLDVFPMYWPYAIDKVKCFKDKDDNFNKIVIKTILIITIVTWCLVFLALCAFRYNGMEFILKSTIQQNKMALENTDVYTPLFRNSMGYILMTFLNFVNIGTSAFVLLASYLSYTPISEKKKIKQLSIETSLNEIRGKKNAEIAHLDEVINHDYANEEAAKHNAKLEEAKAQAQMKKVEAREDLAKFHHDSDVTATITDSSKSIVA